jgi:septal ring factor EnvC (AmiA/AmiB activator)
MVMNQHYKHLLLYFVLLASTASFGQNKDELQKKKDQLQTEINQTNSLLNTAKKEKVQSVITLRTLNKKIENRNEVIQTLQIEVQMYSLVIDRLKAKIDSTKKGIEFKQNELAKLKENYANMIEYAYRNRSKYDRLAFVFSSESFYQAYKRVRYLQEYSSFRIKQADQIALVELELEKELDRLKTEKALIAVQKVTKRNLLSQSLNEQESLSIEKIQQKNLLSVLKNKENQLKVALKKKEEQAKKLNRQIKKIIEEEIRLARNKAKKNGKVKFDMTPEQKELGDKFTYNKGKLPWPVERGVIIENFGIQKHPVLAGIETFNNGIKLTTEKGSFVRAIFDGVVSRIINIPGAGKAIIVNHGDYFTVYSNLSNVLVKTGEYVDLKQNIGVVITNKKSKESITELQIWKSDEKLDPSQWLYKAY